MAFALVLGAVIGSERQFRGRMAGLRTNALVSLGAAGFVTFAALYPDDINPTRVAAQVVSGIGFLGAGIIFRDGFNIQGINTAATLWCSAAVGLISGSGCHYASGGAKNMSFPAKPVCPGRTLTLRYAVGKEHITPSQGKFE